MSTTEGFAIRQQKCKSVKWWWHLTADEMDVLLNLRNPLPQDGKQLGDGGPRVSENLSALQLTGVKEGELCMRWEKDKTETKVYCNANQIDRWNPCETPTYACRESTKRSTLNFRDRLRDRFFQITNLGKCLCCASRAEWNQMRRWKEYYEPNEAWREPDCCWKQITSAFSPALPTFWIHCGTVCIGLTGSAGFKRTLTRFIKYVPGWKTVRSSHFDFQINRYYVWKWIKNNIRTKLDRNYKLEYLW